MIVRWNGRYQHSPGKGGIPGEVKPRGAENWPVLGGKLGRNQMLAIDPRPYVPVKHHCPFTMNEMGVLTRPNILEKHGQQVDFKSGKNAHGRDGLNVD